MSAIPESVKISLQQCLIEHAHRWWPELAGVSVRYRGQYAYVDGELTDGGELALMRLGYTGSEDQWDFYLYQASTDTYEIGVTSGGEIEITGTPERALDGVCEIHIRDEF